jgi:hypothetical protein
MTVKSQSRILTREISVKSYVFANALPTSGGIDYFLEGYMRFTLPKNIAEVLSLKFYLAMEMGTTDFYIISTGITDNAAQPLAGNLNRYDGGPWSKDSNNYIIIGPLEMKNLLFDLKTSSNYLYYKFNDKPPADASGYPRLHIWKADLTYTMDRGIKT